MDPQACRILSLQERRDPGSELQKKKKDREVQLDGMYLQTLKRAELMTNLKKWKKAGKDSPFGFYQEL